MQTSRYAAAVVGAAILASAVACSSSGTSPTANAPTTSRATTASPSASGNPLAGLTADQIAARASANFRTISSVHVAGTAADSGQKMTMDLTLGTKGCTGTLGVKGQGSFRLLKIGKNLWVKPDDKFWKYVAGSSASPEVMQIVSGKYIKPASKGSGLAAIGALCSPNQFADAFAGQPNGLVKGMTTTISGQPALQIKDTGDKASVYVSISAQPQFLRLDGGGDGQLDFTRHNAPLHLTPPPASQTLDGAKYGF